MGEFMGEGLSACPVTAADVPQKQEMANSGRCAGRRGCEWSCPFRI